MRKNSIQEDQLRMREFEKCHFAASNEMIDESLFAPLTDENQEELLEQLANPESVEKEEKRIF